MADTITWYHWMRASSQSDVGDLRESHPSSPARLRVLTSSPCSWLGELIEEKLPCLLSNSVNSLVFICVAWELGECSQTACLYRPSTCWAGLAPCFDNVWSPVRFAAARSQARLNIESPEMGNEPHVARPEGSLRLIAADIRRNFNVTGTRCLSRVSLPCDVLLIWLDCSSHHAAFPLTMELHKVKLCK